MKYNLRSVGLFLLFACFVWSCEESSGTQENQAEDTLMTVIPMDTLMDIDAPTIDPALLGTWELKEIWIDGNLMEGAAASQTFIEFTPEGTLTSVAPGMDPLSARFRVEDPLILSEVFEGDIEILSLTEAQLELLDVADNSEMRYVYSRK